MLLLRIRSDVDGLDSLDRPVASGSPQLHCHRFGTPNARKIDCFERLQLADGFQLSSLI